MMKLLPLIHDHTLAHTCERPGNDHTEDTRCGRGVKRVANVRGFRFVSCRKPICDESPFRMSRRWCDDEVHH